MNGYRAWAQSITYDEAFTYDWFLSGSVGRVFTAYSANNHVLFSLLAKLTTEVFGPSELSLRLPSLVGGTFYLASVFGLCRLVHGEGFLFILTVAALTLNPFILDFLSAARGYGLALAFFSIALFELGRYLLDGEAKPRRSWLRASLALALSVSSNLAFLFPAASLALVFLGMVALADPGPSIPADHPLGALRRARLMALWFCLPGLLTSLVILAVPLSGAGMTDFFFGADRLDETIRSLVEASLHHHPTRWPIDTEGRLFVSVVGLIARYLVPATMAAVLALVSWLALRALHARSTAVLGRTDRFLLLVGGTLLLTVPFLAATRALSGLPYPLERTGLYFIFLFILATAVLVRKLQELPGSARLLALPGLAALLLLVGQFAAQFNLTHYRTWRYDAGTRAIFEIITRWPLPEDGRPMRVAASRWRYVPSLNFYRLTHRAEGVSPLTDDWAPGEWDYDFFVLEPGPDLEATRAVATPVYVDTVSGAVLCANYARLGTGRAAAAPPVAKP